MLCILICYNSIYKHHDKHVRSIVCHVNLSPGVFRAVLRSGCVKKQTWRLREMWIWTWKLRRTARENQQKSPENMIAELLIWKGLPTMRRKKKYQARIWKREKELAKVTIKREDVELIMGEMEISRAVAERSLREHMGNVVEALIALTN
uniref:Nascent polypeptide-associated complex subunit alpha-like UBA domain-containing protein n=2 Tax=Cyprinus carpio TaxID=7962 RepID=A0A9J8B921_CYPCA